MGKVVNYVALYISKYAHNYVFKFIMIMNEIPTTII